MSTEISWTDETWNPVTGCDQVSPGCDNCYALGMAARLKAMGQPKYQLDGDPATSGPGFGVAVHPDSLSIPLRWRKSRRIFVNSMSDLFHKEIPDDYIARVFAVMSLAQQHTFQLLTKRHARLRSLLSSPQFPELVKAALRDMRESDLKLQVQHARDLPLANVWLGVSVENQQWADIRIPALLETPAAIRFLSCEPLLGEIDFRGLLSHGIDWVIVGGESGRSFRKMNVDWLCWIVQQCRDADVPVWVKQDSARSDGQRGRIPDDFWVQEFPAEARAA